jgi:hypothetical protein
VANNFIEARKELKQIGLAYLLAHELGGDNDNV